MAYALRATHHEPSIQDPPEYDAKSIAIHHDALLVVRARSGSKSAKSELYLRHVARARQIARRVLGSNEADDVIQEAFLTAFESLAQLRNLKLFNRWLAAIVVRTAHAWMRHRRALARLGFAPALAADFEVLPSKQTTAPDLGAELAGLCVLLAKLPRDAQIAFVLHKVEGRTMEEIAMAMDVSESTAKRHVRAAEALLLQGAAAVGVTSVVTNVAELPGYRS